MDENKAQENKSILERFFIYIILSVLVLSLGAFLLKDIYILPDGIAGFIWLLTILSSLIGLILGFIIKSKNNSNKNLAKIMILFSLWPILLIIFGVIVYITASNQPGFSL